jgi:hypothetical protein
VQRHGARSGRRRDGGLPGMSTNAAHAVRVHRSKVLK